MRGSEYAGCQNRPNCRFGIRTDMVDLDSSYIVRGNLIIEQRGVLEMGKERHGKKREIS